jgi:sigma-E factor negative regulatory protein RseB
MRPPVACMAVGAPLRQVRTLSPLGAGHRTAALGRVLARLPSALLSALALLGTARADGPMPQQSTPLVRVNAPMAEAVAAGDARLWLARMQQAARSGNYIGTLVYSSQGQLSSSRVWHFRVGDKTYERLESLDGYPQRILRVDNEVRTLWPQRKLAVIETRQNLSGWSTTPQAVDPLALESYRLLREQVARVAGREAQVLLLEPRDALRYAQRLWADIATGLMLRADVLAATTGVPVTLESHAFSELEQGVRPDPAQVMRPFEQLDGYQVRKPVQKATTLEAEGWTIARPVAGFRLAGCLKRGMAGGAGDAVLQVVFTDGLMPVSLFLETYRPDRHQQPMQAQRGATATLSVRRGEHWLTLVGDVPPETLALFADALERRP